MGRKKDDAPRVVGFDFGSPAGAPMPEPAPAATGYPPPAPPAGYAPPAEQAPPPAYEPPPGYAPSAYPPPAPPPGYAPPVEYAAPPAYRPPAPFTPEEYAAQYGAPPAYGAQPSYAAQPAYAAPAYAAQPAYAAPTTYPPPGYGAPGAPDPYWGGPPAPGPQSWEVPGYGTDLRPPPKTSRVIPIGGIVRVVVVLLVVGGAVKGAMRALKPPVSLPASIGGAPRDDSPQARQLAKSAAAEIENVHAKNSAVYGSPGAFTYLLVAGDSDDKSGRGMYDTYAKEVRQDGDRTSPAETYGDITCTTTRTVRDGAFSVCFWGGADSDGIVAQFDAVPLEELAAVTAEARAAIN